MHLIALGLKKKNPDLKWVADFRDPWSELDLLEEFHLTKKSKQKYRKLEKEVLENADVTLTVSESWVKSFKSLGSSNVKLITNGFDEDDFDVRQLESDKFIIGHFGLLNHLRNPRNLWKTLNDLCDENPDFKISLLNLDVDVYEPSVIILDYLFPLIVKGGILILDDYGTFPGETKAVDDYFKGQSIKIQKFPFCKTPRYLIKK